MKKYLILFIAVVSTTFFVGCDSEDDFTPPNYATFGDVKTYSSARTISVASEGSETVELTVYTNSTSGSARTLGVNVLESSTLDPSTYSIPESVTIPANSNEGTISVEITGAGIDNAGDVLMLQLEEQADIYVGNPLTLNLVKVCPFDVTGSFENTSVVLGGATNPTIRPVQIVAGAAENQYIAKNLYEDGKDVTFTVNPDTNAITLATQPGFTHSQYGAANVTGLAGSRVEPCLNQITLVIRIDVSAGSFAARTDVLERTGDVSEGEGEGEGSEGEGEGEGSEGEGEDDGSEDDGEES